MWDACDFTGQEMREDGANGKVSAFSWNTEWKALTCLSQTREKQNSERGMLVLSTW